MIYYYEGNDNVKNYTCIKHVFYFYIIKYLFIYIDILIFDKYYIF